MAWNNWRALLDAAHERRCTLVTEHSSGHSVRLQSGVVSRPWVSVVKSILTECNSRPTACFVPPRLQEHQHVIVARDVLSSQQRRHAHDLQTHAGHQAVMRWPPALLAAAQTAAVVAAAALPAAAWPLPPPASWLPGSCTCSARGERHAQLRLLHEGRPHGVRS